MIKDITVISASGSGQVAGPPGASAYAVAVQAGFIGTLADWLLSLRGDDGPKGDPGDSPTLLLIQTILASAPTSEPGTPNKIWWNGGVLALTG